MQFRLPFRDLSRVSRGILLLAVASLTACRAPVDLETNPLRTAAAKRTFTAPRKGTIASTAQVSDENVRPEETKALPVEPANCRDFTPPLPYHICATGDCCRDDGCFMDEYLCDGGDELPGVRVAADWTVLNLGIEDTVAHYDTVPGQTCVAPSNKVCIYAPRFRSVRHITRLAMDEEHARPTGFEAPAPPVLVEGLNVPTTTLEQDKPHVDAQDRLALAYENRIHDGAVSMRLKPIEYIEALLPYENLQIIKLGRFDQREKAMLMEGTDAAITWTQDKAVQILLDSKAALSVTKTIGPDEVFETEDPCPGKLRICKVASTQFAKPGDVIDFTLRYDNVGSQAIGNVTIVDNLTTRLEFVEGSAQSSRQADFYTERNEVESLVLRWEITDPLPPGDGGVLRFKCRVR
jgi:uncharacterized repeat protein (TIGR01451 family)